MESCIFCQIAKKKIPSEIIYEDKDLIAILDVAPVHLGHTLIISKRHYSNLLKTPEKILAKMVTLGKKIGKKQLEALGAHGFNLTSNTHPAAGQSVLHVHFHIIPRYEKDGLKSWRQKKYKPGEAEKIAKKLRLN
jgi:histidine triad (HIT) family protein